MRDRTRELRAAERERDAALADRAEAQLRLDALAAAHEALAETEVTRIYEAEGARPAPSSPEAFAQTLRADLARYREVAQAANIRLE